MISIDAVYYCLKKPRKHTEEKNVLLLATKIADVDHIV